MIERGGWQYEDTAAYARAAAEYIQTVRDESGKDYSVERWLRDIKLNYPEDLEALPICRD